MRKVPKLTAVEWETMETIWALGGSPSVRDVLDHAYPNGEKAYTTVQTIMNTLEKKGLLARKKTGLVNFYTPKVSRDHAVRREMINVVKRVFHGSVPALASHLIDQADLKPEEIDAIKQVVDRKAREIRSKKP
jgi:BlaI family penicillinase repressor